MRTPVVAREILLDYGEPDVESPGEVVEKHYFEPSDTFVRRHLGPSESERREMLETLGCASLDELVDQTIPKSIRLQKPLELGPPRAEDELIAELKRTMDENRVMRSMIGCGYYDCITPPVILRNVLENPGWYTQYTPYQAEIAQGRLEALINFQTMVADLTGLPLANSSLLDEGTAAAEAMAMAHRIVRDARIAFFVADDCHPQTIAVMKTRAVPLGIELKVGKVSEIDFEGDKLFGALVSYPTTDGRLERYEDLAERAHTAKAMLCVATDLLALTVLRPPGEFGADIAIGSTQRFGVPMGFGGPHAAFLATDSKHSRQVPGRIIGVTKDAGGRPAYRLALQTREQHIRRDRATSNICTAQVLLAVIASMYAVYHGKAGLERIAKRVHAWTRTAADGLTALGFDVGNGTFFDTLRVQASGQADALLTAAAGKGINLRRFDADSVGISFDETTCKADIEGLLAAFADVAKKPAVDVNQVMAAASEALPKDFVRTSDYFTHPVFSSHHSEHQLLRYLHQLQSRDLSLTTSMIPLGSCTMKLNATSEMIPVTWPTVGKLHPFAPKDQAAGYHKMFAQLEQWLAEITGFHATSLMPNAGAQGEYAGLLAIRGYHEARGDGARNICLIPTSAHGTNPASAVMAGYTVVPVKCDEHGNIDVGDLKDKAEKHKDTLASVMITYPSTHGVFEASIREICETVHKYGGQVYLDGANMNAQVGLCRPGDYGADVCHLNLHKTFCIPHGGGGPGMGPICVVKHLEPHLPRHPMTDQLTGEAGETGPVSAAPYGSPSILPISWVYIALMGASGLKQASEVAILNANYMAKRLEGAYQVLFRGENDRVAHEFVLDLRPFKKTASIEVEDVAKRLMDYGFHAPTMSWPVPGTLMVEPTESESKGELDRFCEAMLSIREEIRAVEEGRIDRANNPLKRAPHTAREVTATEWDRPYTRHEAAYPAPYLNEHKFWPAVQRVDNTYGDRNLMCSCPPMEAFAED